MPKSLVIAHRGDSSRALENSLEAFRLALSIPVDMIEFDIRKSRDNCLYVMHDKETGRTADNNIDIERSLADDIARVRLKNGEPIPSLNDVLALVAGKVGLNIEIKSDGAGALTAAHIVGTDYQGKLMISSFKEREVIDAKRVMPNVRAAGIFDAFAPSDVTAYRAKGYPVISLNRKTVSQELIDSLHSKKIEVYVWTIDTREEAERLISWGADGIYSNEPAMLRSIVG
ncbi:MAG: glycerophosphodiester phosphodiesterase [Nitrospirota bacterium]